MQTFVFLNSHLIALQVQFVSQQKKCYAFDKLFYYWFVLFHYVLMLQALMKKK